MTITLPFCDQSIKIKNSETSLFGEGYFKKSATSEKYDRSCKSLNDWINNLCNFDALLEMIIYFYGYDLHKYHVRIYFDSILYGIKWHHAIALNLDTVPIVSCSPDLFQTNPLYSLRRSDMLPGR